MKEKKFCPFRKDKNGEFAECYGERCMAYIEYDQPVFPSSLHEEMKEPPVHVKVCKMMPQPVFYSGGCA